MTKPLQEDDLAAIRARANQCVPGPWVHRGDGFIESPGHRVIGVTCAGGGDCGGGDKLPRGEHAEFLAAAREDIPRLLDEVDRLRGELDRLRGPSRDIAHSSVLVPPPKLPIHLPVR